MQQKRPAEAKTIQDYDALCERLRLLESQMQEVSSSGDSGAEKCAGIFLEMADCCKQIGRHNELLTYLKEARRLCPELPGLAPQLAEAGIYEDEERPTPWDHERAIKTYNDIQDLRDHWHLPFDDFFKQTRAGRIRRSICERLKNLTQSGDRILEAGCAAGGYYASLKPFIDTSHYTALDITPGMVRCAKTNFPELDVLRSDVRNLGFRDNTFAVTFSTDVLMHIENWQQGLRELYRVSERVLILRIRAHTDPHYPTLVTKIGAGAYHVPYIINGIGELHQFVAQLTPTPYLLDAGSISGEPMHPHLWHIAETHPELMQKLRESDAPGLTYCVDITILKQRNENYLKSEK